MLRATIASLLAIASAGAAFAQTQDTASRNDADTSYASADQVRQVLVLAVAIRRLDEQHVGLGDRRRIAHDRPARLAQVA